MKKILSIILCAALMSQLVCCSLMNSSTQQIRINCKPQDGVQLVVNGQKQPKCPVDLELERMKKITIEAMGDGFLPYQKTIDYHLNDVGKLDTVGAILILVPIIGLWAPGAWDFDETTIEVVLIKDEKENLATP